ncbi:MAG: 50S ribosomal protein L11 methyltransferase [Desulfuromonadales bacterium]|nr:50S ribosomal protein L11 methyltransferase [Desulfuromonadales bacterium]
MRADYRPFEVGNRFRIVPPDNPETVDGRINLVMERGAFGSGEHETTCSCIEIIENLPDVEGARLLDLGSGTGILSIAALKLGAASACCIDIEQEAVTACRHNCSMNNVADRVRHLCGTLDRLAEGDFDLVLANIYGDILLEVADGLVARAKPGARILLSGILWEYNFDVRQRYQNLGCSLIKNYLLEEFSTVHLRKD